MPKSVLKPTNRYDLDVKQRIRLYKLLLFSQIIGTVLMVVGFIVLLLILAKIIQI